MDLYADTVCTGTVFRLGLGAQPAAAHKQLAEDRKIKNRLLGKNPRALGDEGAVVKLQNGNRDAADASGSDDDEEESRAGAIGKKGKGTSNGTQNKKDYINPFLLPKAKPSTPLKSDIHAAADVGGKALFNAPSPAKPAPLARASPQSSASTSISKAAPLVAASAFYGGGGGHDGAAGAQLTKNQRKKERQREKAAALKRQREEESRLEEETEQRKRIKTGDTVQGKRSADGNDELADANMDATEHGVETLRASSGSNDDDGGEALSPNRSQADSATAAAGGASSPGKRKKKKKKASFGAGSGSGAVAEGPLLNLG